MTPVLGFCIRLCMLLVLRHLHTIDLPSNAPSSTPELRLHGHTWKLDAEQPGRALGHCDGG